ncbi:MAG: 4-alpha-glucanotransferase [Lachnospiraceae bacterium]|nr:4-alpha-glucanotransferase [Lachnospiraceae bacterium]
MRRSGILMPITAFPSAYGIGSFSKEAYAFVDFLARAEQSLWQILPLGPTGYGDSPYQSFSTFAGNPYFIDPDELVERGWLSAKDCAATYTGASDAPVDYEHIYNTRFKLLRKAYEKSGIASDPGYKKFVKENAFWLDDYALYMAVKNSFGGSSWTEWDEDIRLRKKAAMDRYTGLYADEIGFYKFQQYMFCVQWNKLKDHANERGVKIVGDIPIYVAFDSADTWSHPELFQLDKDNKPVGVAGCPPDAFSATGQLWGNALYKWDYHRKTGYKWWIQRFEYCYRLYDVIRIDHFRGFDEYYSIPYGDSTAEFGHWEQGPGYDIFKAMKDALGQREVIAEDLGFLTDTVLKLVRKTGYPGMKVLLFAFDHREPSDYLPHAYTSNSVVYTGTHDNDTVEGWIRSASPRDVRFAMKYLGVKRRAQIRPALIRAAHACVADTCIIPMQDYLGLDNEARINMPSTVGGNWVWRMSPDALTDELCDEIRDLTVLYGRSEKTAR